MFITVFLVSLVIATFFGHFIHWALHQRWTGPAYRGHMEHHLELYPPGNLTSEKYRSAKWYHSGPFLFTPAAIVILGTVGGLLWALETPLWAIVVFGVTLVGFGLLNDWVHDSQHVTNHWASRFEWFRRARTLHFKHHRNMKSNFGIMFFGWDRVFGTFRKK